MAQRLALASRSAPLVRALVRPAAAAAARCRIAGNDGGVSRHGICRRICSTPVLLTKAADDDGDDEIPLKDKPESELTPYERECLQAQADHPDGEEVPVWQNPRHHADPKHYKVFFDEFGPDDGPPEISKLPPFDPPGGGVCADPELHALAEETLALNMLEVRELTRRIADHFGFDDQLLGMGASAGGGGGDGGGAGRAEEEAPAEEERTHFDLKLVSFDAKSKIKVIKEVRAVGGLGLKEAKEMVEGAPKVVAKGVKKDEMEGLKEKLEAAGAVVEVV